MYKLKSANQTNDWCIPIILKETDKIIKIKEKASIENIQFLLFNKDIDEKLYKLLTVSLTLGDEIKVPIHKKVADILYFSLCYNYFIKSNFKITNLTQASTLYEMYDNDYNKIDIPDDERALRFTTLNAQHNCILDNFILQWKIPVGFFRLEGKTKVTLAGTAYCILKIKNDEFKIPRLIFIKFFKESLVKGRLICDSTDELKSKFNLNNFEALEETLNYIGYEKNLKYSNVTLPEHRYYVEDNLIYSIGNNLILEEQDFWVEITSSKYVLLPNINYIPIKQKKGGEQNTVSLYIK